MSISINSRGDLYGKFQSRLKGTQESLEEDLELEFEQNMVKTYIVESNVSPPQFLKKSEFIKDSRQIEKDLYEVNIDVEEKPLFYLDFEDERFWSLYTLETSETARKTVKKLTTRDRNGLDRLWIPNNSQREIMDYGAFQGAGFSQHGERAFPKDIVNVRDMRLELDGTDAQRFYKEFKKSSDIDKVLSLSRVIIRRERGDDHLVERITNTGAFTARRGTNIDIHLDTVSRVKKKYRTIIDAIEENHQIDYEERDHGVRVTGRHLTVTLENTITDVDEFISHLVDPGPPFRLLGPSTNLGKDYRKVRGVDLHNGDRVTLEIEPSEIRIYLYEGDCGNSALRIFTNLQQYYDPSASMEVRGIEDV